MKYKNTILFRLEFRPRTTRIAISFKMYVNWVTLQNVFSFACNAKTHNGHALETAMHTFAFGFVVHAAFFMPIVCKDDLVDVFVCCLFALSIVLNSKNQRKWQLYFWSTEKNGFYIFGFVWFYWRCRASLCLDAYLLFEIVQLQTIFATRFFLATYFPFATLLQFNECGIPLKSSRNILTEYWNWIVFLNKLEAIEKKNCMSRVLNWYLNQNSPWMKFQLVCRLKMPHTSTVISICFCAEY